MLESAYSYFKGCTIQFHDRRIDFPDPAGFLQTGIIRAVCRVTGTGEWCPRTGGKSREFNVIPERRITERAFPWLENYGRPAIGCESPPKSAEAMAGIVFIEIVPDRFCRSFQNGFPRKMRNCIRIIHTNPPRRLQGQFTLLNVRLKRRRSLIPVMNDICEPLKTSKLLEKGYQRVIKCRQILFAGKHYAALVAEILQESHRFCIFHLYPLRSFRTLAENLG